MAALPNNNLTMSAIRNAIGESTNSAYQLIRSHLVNRWGFNSPMQVQQNKYWGVPNDELVAPFELGAFRGYDHDWQAFGMYFPIIDSTLAYYDTGTINVRVSRLSGTTNPSPSISINFQLYFSRTPFSTQNAGTLINEAFVSVNDGGFYYQLNPLNPPDNGGVLTENSTVYFKVVRTSSEARRWDDNSFSRRDDIPTTISKSDTDTYIIPIFIGTDLYTYYGSLSVDGSTTSYVYDNGTIDGGELTELLLYNGNRYAVDYTVQWDINNLSDFTGALGTSVSDTFSVPAASIVNGSIILGSARVALSIPDIQTAWAVGNSYYGRVRITAATGGTFNSSWSTAARLNGTVQSQLPS